MQAQGVRVDTTDPVGGECEVSQENNGKHVCRGTVGLAEATPAIILCRGKDSNNHIATSSRWDPVLALLQKLLFMVGAINAGVDCESGGVNYLQNEPLETKGAHNGVRCDM